MTEFKKRTFEDYLQEWHIKLFPQILDDELSDAFDAWLSGRETQDIINYAENYGTEQYLAGIDEALNKVKRFN